MKIRERLEKSFRMSQSRPRPLIRVRRKPRRPLRQDLRRPIDRRILQMAGVLLVPGQAAAVPVNADSQAMLVSYRGHRSPQTSPRAVGKAEKQIGIVLDSPSGYDLAQFRSDFSHFEAGDKSGQLVG